MVTIKDALKIANKELRDYELGCANDTGERYIFHYYEKKIGFITPLTAFDHMVCINKETGEVEVYNGGFPDWLDDWLDSDDNPAFEKHYTREELETLE